MAIVITMTVDGGTLADYAAVQRKLMHTAPDGLLLHVAHAVPEGIRLVEVWESAEQQEAFLHEFLMPAVAGGGLEGIVPRVTVSELGNLWAPNGVTLEAMSNEGLA